MKKSTKTTITKKEYYQLWGLQTLAKSYSDKIEDLEKLAFEVTGKFDDFGYTTDMIYNDRDINYVLEQLGIEVIKE